MYPFFISMPAMQREPLAFVIYIGDSRLVPLFPPVAGAHHAEGMGTAPVKVLI